MSRFLLFTGEKGVGKTTALRQVIYDVGVENFAGFLAAERRTDGERIGFDIVLLDGRCGSLASVDSDSKIRVGGLNEAGIPRYGVDLEFLENVAIPSLVTELDSPRPKVLVVDEIGPMQLHSVIFQKTITNLVLHGDVTTIGTIVLRSFPWTDELKKKSNVESFMLTQQNRNTMAEMMSAYVRGLLSRS